MAITERSSGLAAVTYKSGPNLSAGAAGGLAGPGAGLGAWEGPLWTSGPQVDVYGWRDQSNFPQATFDVIYRTQPWVAAVVNKLVRQISRTPLRAFEYDSQNNKRYVTWQDDHPGSSLDKLLRWPAPRKGAIHLKQWFARPLMVFGNSLVAKYRETQGLPPTELIPVDWRYIDAFAMPGGEVEWWRTMQLGQPRYIPWDATVHTAWDSDGCIGVSPLEQLSTSVQIEDAAQRLQRSSFQNASRPSGAIALPQNMQNVNDAQLKQMKQDIEAMHRGVDNAFRVALLAPGAQWVPMSFNLQDAGLLQSRQFEREEICAVYDVKPSQVGAISTPGAGYGSVVEVNRDLYRTTLPPWFTLIEETIECQLIRPEPMWEGMHVGFDSSEALQGDPETVSGMMATEVGVGLRSYNEGRRPLGLPSVDDPMADKLLYPANNMAPIDQNMEQTPSQAPEVPDTGPAK